MGKSYKWLLIAMLSFAFFFHQADRALFGLLTIPIQDELNLTGGQMGWINGALFATLAIMTPIAGFCGDRFSRKWLITGSLIFWSITTACMGFVGDFHVLGLVIPAFLSVMFFRSIATGGGESFYAPSAYALIAVHHKETRSVALRCARGMYPACAEGERVGGEALRRTRFLAARVHHLRLARISVGRGLYLFPEGRQR